MHFCGHHDKSRQQFLRGSRQQVAETHLIKPEFSVFYFYLAVLHFRHKCFPGCYQLPSNNVSHALCVYALPNVYQIIRGRKTLSTAPRGAVPIKVNLDFSLHF